jgi:hypothetical protein
MVRPVQPRLILWGSDDHCGAGCDVNPGRDCKGHAHSGSAHTGLWLAPGSASPLGGASSTKQLRVLPANFCDEVLG